MNGPALRLSYGVVQRSPRIVPNSGLQYEDFTIPPGYIVGMDTFHMHHNEEIFPDSHAFIPERWLHEDGTTNKTLRKYNVAFSRGTRQCAGMNLAQAELHLILSMVFRRFDMKLWETDDSVVELEADMFLPKWKGAAAGVRVKVKSTAN